MKTTELKALHGIESEVLSSKQKQNLFKKFELGGNTQSLINLKYYWDKPLKGGKWFTKLVHNIGNFPQMSLNEVESFIHNEFMLREIETRPLEKSHGFYTILNDIQILKAWLATLPFEQCLPIEIRKNFSKEECIAFQKTFFIITTLENGKPWTVKWNQLELCRSIAYAVEICVSREVWNNTDTKVLCKNEKAYEMKMAKLPIADLITESKKVLWQTKTLLNIEVKVAGMPKQDIN